MQNIRIDRQTAFFFLTLGLLAVGGVWLLSYSTPQGLGLNDDSIAYIAGARSILSGQGYREAWLISNGPVTHFPPGFPAVLAFIGFISGLDPLRGARALNGLLFGLNVALVGWLGWSITKSRIWGVLTAILTLLSSSLLYIHSRAMSEPLYIFLMLLSFLVLHIYFKRFKRWQNWFLVALGTLLGWAYLARYAALSLLATILVVLFVLYKDRRSRIRGVVVLLLSAFPWILGWSVRNRIVGGSFTNRVLGWHPITLMNWKLGVKTFAEFLIPVHEWRTTLRTIPYFFEIILFVGGLGLFVWVLGRGFQYLFRPAKSPRSDVLTFTNGLYVIAYLAALFATMTLFDPATKFQVRILSPTYISLLLLLTAFANWLWHRHVVWRPFIFMLSVLVLGMFAYGQMLSVQDLRKGGGGFAGEKWSQSEIVVALNKLPDDILILSNEPGVVYLYTERPSGVLPKGEPGISNIKQLVLDGQIVLALFRVNAADANTIEYYYDLGRGLRLTDYRNAWLFSAFP